MVSLVFSAQISEWGLIAGRTLITRKNGKAVTKKKEKNPLAGCLKTPLTTDKHLFTAK